jgi:hypothetical protein
MVKGSDTRMLKVRVKLDTWIKSAACMPMIWTPRISSVFLLYMTFAIPSPSFSAKALLLALKCPILLPTSNPCSLPKALADSSLRPTKAISGWVKQAAGMAL